MNQEELQAFLEGLEEVLTEAGLLSIVDQERQAAAEGRSVEEQGGRRGDSGVQIAPLSFEDRVAMLLDLTEIAVGGTHVISTKLSDLASEEFNVYDEERLVQFSPSLTEGLRPEEATSWHLPDRGALADRQPAVQAVLDTLVEMREAAGLKRTPELEPRPNLREHAREAGWA